MATYDENNEGKTPATGVVGTVLGGAALAVASGLLGNGGLNLGGNNQANALQAQVAEKDTQIAKLEAMRYSDTNLKDATANVNLLAQRVTAIETAVPLREQIVLGKVQEVATSLKGVNDAVQVQISGISQTLAGIVRPFVPNYALAPGYGPAFVAPMPPPFPPAVPTVNARTTGGTADATKATAGA